MLIKSSFEKLKVVYINSNDKFYKYAKGPAFKGVLESMSSTSGRVLRVNPFISWR